MLDIATVREAIRRITEMLAGKGIEVSQSGFSANVICDAYGRPVRINLPYMPDNSSPELVSAVQGFLDNEVSRVLFTDFDTMRKYAGSAQEGLIKAIEQVRVQREMIKKFPGSAHNIGQLVEFFGEKVVKPNVEQALAAGDTNAAVAQLMPMMVRAAAGEDRAARFLDDATLKPVCDPIMDILKEFEKELTTSATTEDAVETAENIRKKLKTPLPPPSARKRRGATEEEEPTPREEEEDEEEEATSSPSSSAAPSSKPKPKPAAEEKPAPGEANDELAAEEIPEGTDETGEEATAGQAEKTDEEKLEEAKAKAREREGKLREGEDRYLDGDESEAEEAEGKTSPESASRERQESEKGERGDDEAGDGDGASGDGSGVGDPDGEKTGGDVDNSEEDGDEVVATADAFCDSKAGMDQASDVIRKQTIATAKDCKYLVWSVDDDKIGEPVQINASHKERVKKLEEKVDHMIGSLAKDLERAIAARSLATWESGRRSGRIHGAALSRLASGDDRVFRRKQEAKSKDVAVELVIDCSGSMGGAKIKLAAEAGYALSMTLERMGIAHEVIGFTTGNVPHAKSWSEMEETLHSARTEIGRDYSRIESLVMPLMKGFGERLNQETKARFVATPDIHLRNNVDGECIEIAAKRLASRREAGKIMIVLSDGSPYAQGNNASQVAHLKKVVKKIEASGIKTVGIGIMDESVSKFYSKHVVMNKLEELPSQVIHQLRSLMLSN